MNDEPTPENQAQSQNAVGSSDWLDVPEIDCKNFVSFGEMLEALLTGRQSVPVWIRFGRARHKVTDENKYGVCRGMLMALEYRSQNGHI